MHGFYNHPILYIDLRDCGLMFECVWLPLETARAINHASRAIFYLQ